MKVTFSDLQASRIPASVGLCSTDPRLLALTNECLERLMYEGHWHNTVQRIQFCATDGCITQPPQVATIEKVAVCGQPVTLRTPWYEFMDSGLGIRYPVSDSSSTCCGSGGGWCGFNEALPRGYFPTFRDITGTDKLVNLVCDLASDVGKEALVLGYNSEGIWIRTLQDGTIQDGELIAFSQSAGTNSVNTFSVITDIQFNEARDGQVWAYQYDQTTTDKVMVGSYMNWETRPNLPRWFFPGIIPGTSSGGGCNQTRVEAMVKLNFWPCAVPTDYLCVPCLPAIKELAMGILAAELEPDAIRKVQITAAAMVSAKTVLNSQLAHFTGDGAVPTLNVVGSGHYSDPVPALM